MPKFAEALDREAETIKRPPPPPVGHYTMRVARAHTIQEGVDKNGRDYEITKIPMEVLEAMEDVDPDELEEFGKVAGVQVLADFYFPSDDENRFEASLVRLKRFLIDHLGVEPATMKQMLADSINMQCIGEIGHRPDPNDPEVVYAELKNTTKI